MEVVSYSLTDNYWFEAGEPHACLLKHFKYYHHANPAGIKLKSRDPIHAPSSLTHECMQYYYYIHICCTLVCNNFLSNASIRPAINFHCQLKLFN